MVWQHNVIIMGNVHPPSSIWRIKVPQSEFSPYYGIVKDNSDCKRLFRGNIFAAAQRCLERLRAGEWTLKACNTGQMLPKLNITLLMYICRDEHGNVTHFLPVVKCTLICCSTQSEPRSIFRPLWRQALNWLDVGEKADWLAGGMFTLCCLYVVLQNGSWWELNITHWKCKYRGILGPKQLESS